MEDSSVNSGFSPNARATGKSVTTDNAEKLLHENVDHMGMLPQTVIPHEFVNIPDEERRGIIRALRWVINDEDIFPLGENISAHDFRRTFATMSNELGMTKTDTAILLSQSMRDVTEGYIQRTLEIKRNNLEKIEKLAVMGFVEVIRHLGFFRDLSKRVLAEIDKCQPATPFNPRH